MVGMNKHLAAALVLGLAVSVLATPSFAQRSDGGEAGMSSAREKALRDCNGEAGKMSQGTWGHQQLDNYRHLHGAPQRGEGAHRVERHVRPSTKPASARLCLNTGSRCAGGRADAEIPGHRHRRLLPKRALHLDREQQTAGPEQGNELTPFKVEHGASSPMRLFRAADWPVLSLPKLQPAAGRPASPWGKPELF